MTFEVTNRICTYTIMKKPGFNLRLRVGSVLKSQGSYMVLAPDRRNNLNALRLHSASCWKRSSPQ
jgi:hypothetical protein